MAEDEHDVEAEEAAVTDVPEPDQDVEEEEAEERLATPEEAPGEPAEAVAEQGVSAEEWEERHKKAEKEFRRYTNSVGRIYAEDALAYLPCPLCGDPPAGFVHPASAGHFPDDVIGAVMMLLGQTSVENVQKDPYSEICDTCVGWGVVRTGSHVPNQETRTCLDCKGLGYRPLGPAVADQFAIAGTSDTGENGVVVPMQTGPESPEIEALRLRGYTIIPPMQTQT